jgi:hypothetical protein
LGKGEKRGTESTQTFLNAKSAAAKYQTRLAILRNFALRSATTFMRLRIKTQQFLKAASCIGITLKIERLLLIEKKHDSPADNNDLSLQNITTSVTSAKLNLRTRSLFIKLKDT